MRISLVEILFLYLIGGVSMIIVMRTDADLEDVKSVKNKILEWVLKYMSQKD